MDLISIIENVGTPVVNTKDTMGTEQLKAPHLHARDLGEGLLLIHNWIDPTN